MTNIFFTAARNRNGVDNDFSSPGYITPLGTSNWYHAVLTLSGTTMTSYLNGVSTGSCTINTGNGAGDQWADKFTIGNDPYKTSTYGYWASAFIDDVVFFDRALTADEVRDLYVFGINGNISLNDGVANGVIAEPSQNKNIPASLSFKFDGTDDYITLPDGDYMKPTTAFTVMGWAKGVTQASSRHVFSNYDEGTSKGWSLYRTSGGVARFLIDGNVADSTKVVGDGLWHWLVATSDGTNMKIYVDGKFEASAAQAFPTYGTSYPRIGCYQDASNFWNGNIMEVAMVNKALSAREISDLYYYYTGIKQAKNYWWILEAIPQALSAVATSVMAINLQKTFLKSLSKIANGVIGLSPIFTFLKTLSKTAVGAISLSKGKVLLKTLSVIAVSAVVRSSVFLCGRALIVVANGVNSIVRNSLRYKDFNIVAVGAIALSRLTDRYKTITRSAVAVLSLSAARLLSKKLTVTAVAVKSILRSLVNLGIGFILGKRNNTNTIGGIVKKD